MYHRYECVIINLVGAFQDTVRSMRLFFYSLYLFNDNIEDLKNFMMSRKDVRMTVFDYDLSDLKSRNSQKNLLHCYDSFVAPAFTNDAYAFRLIFEVHPILSVMWDTHKVFILTFFRRNIAINREYAKDLMKWQDNVKRSITDHRESICKRVGGGIYLFSSLINHSCVPNVERHISYNDKLHLIVCRDVKKGQQIFLSYM